MNFGYNCIDHGRHKSRSTLHLNTYHHSHYLMEHQTKQQNKKIYTINKTTE